MRITPTSRDIVNIDCDTESWLLENHNVKPKKRTRLDELVERKRGRKETVSCTVLATVPDELCNQPFADVLPRYDLPVPWDTDTNFDLLVTNKRGIDRNKFLSEFAFVLVVWFHVADPDTLYVTLEAEHRGGVAQCTYSIPMEPSLHEDIVRHVFDSGIPNFDAPKQLHV